MIAIITSKSCPVGNNVKDNLLSLYTFEETAQFENNPVYALVNDKSIYLYTINELHIKSENLHNKINADLFVFVSTHRSEKQVNSLSVHSIGNWKKAELGGLDNTLVPVNAIYIKELFLELEKNNNLGYETTVEVTHHGPYNKKPCLFIEIGSSEKQWKNNRAGEVLAKTIVNVLTRKIVNEKSLTVFGGTHYSQLAVKIIKRTNFSVGYICPKHSVDSLTEDLIEQTLNKTMPKPEFAVIEWKSLKSEQREHLINKLNALNVEWKRDKDLFKD